MNIKLLPDLEKDVHALTADHGYSPEEIISIGVAMANVLLREMRLGNSVVVVDSDHYELAKFKYPEPKAVREVVAHYLNSLQAGREVSPATLVARLERERDEEPGHRQTPS